MLCACSVRVLFIIFLNFLTCDSIDAIIIYSKRCGVLYEIIFYSDGNKEE